MRVWLIDEGSHGHRSQSEGVIASIRRLGLEPDVVHLRGRERLKGVWRPPARALVDYAPSRLGAWAAKRFALVPEVASQAPDIVISSGGKSIFANIALARRTMAPNVFVGDPRPYPTRWFAGVLSPRTIPGAANVFDVCAPPTPVTPEACRMAAAARWPSGPPARVWTLLVGGTSRSHRFGRQDFERLADDANELAERFGIRWLVSTSRRSGPTAEAALAERLRADLVADSTFFGRCPEPVVHAYLGAADAAFVTQDSLTMLSEAVAAGKPVVALAPQRVRLPAGSIVTDMLRRFESLPGFERRRIGEQAAPPCALDGAAPNAHAVEVLDRAVARLLDLVTR